jgi:hypothetical protein
MIQRCLRHCLLILLAVFISNPVSAKHADMLVRLGDSAYAQKMYDSAAYYYKQAISPINPDPVVLYKLGNAHFRLNRTGEAVLAYERALKRRPGFADAAENLAIIQRRIQPDAGKDDVFFIRWWNALTKPALSNVWAVLSIVFFSFPLGVLIWSRFRRTWPSWLWPQAIVGGIVLSLFFTVLSVAAVPGTSNNSAVVMQKDAAFRTEIKSGSTPSVLKLPEGLVVDVLGNDDNQVRVALPDGREGFMQASDIALVK